MNLDSIGARLLLAMCERPRETVLGLSERARISRNTVQARLARMEQNGTLTSFEHRINPAALGYELAAFVTARVTQQLLDKVAADLEQIPEILEVFGIASRDDLLIRVAARDAEELYRVAGTILATRGVERTETALVMRNLVGYRILPLLNRIASA